jgi:hypothetical protein
MATFTSSHSYLSTAIVSVPDTISMGDPTYYHPEYFAGIPPALGLPAQSLPDTGLFSIQVAFPWLLPLQVKGIVWSDFRRYANRTSNSNFGSSQCYNNRHQLDLRPSVPCPRQFRVQSVRCEHLQLSYDANVSQIIYSFDALKSIFGQSSSKTTFSVCVTSPPKSQYSP